MAVKISNLECDLLKRIDKAKSRGEDVSRFTEIQNKAYLRLVSAGLAENINGFAYVTDKGMKKLRSIK